MNRRSLLSLSTITALGFALVPGGVIAQQKSLKDQIVGSWTLVQAIDTHADGTKTNPWGANPKGAYMLLNCSESANRPRHPSGSSRTAMRGSEARGGAVDKSPEGVRSHVPAKAVEFKVFGASPGAAATLACSVPT
jgi:hypothetical protein